MLLSLLSNFLYIWSFFHIFGILFLTTGTQIIFKSICLLLESALNHLKLCWQASWWLFFHMELLLLSALPLNLLNTDICQVVNVWIHVALRATLESGVAIPGPLRLFDADSRFQSYSPLLLKIPELWAVARQRFDRRPLIWRMVAIPFELAFVNLLIVWNFD